MILIPGFVISLLTFPGVMLHEWAHKLTCKLFGVRVLKVAYFRFNFSLVGGEAGYVIHARPPSYLASLCISGAPLFFNTTAAFLLGIVAYQFHHKDALLEGALLWLAFSIGAHAFPSNQDMSNVTDHAADEHFLIGAISECLYVMMFVLNALKAFWLDCIYAFSILMLVYGNQLFK